MLFGAAKKLKRPINSRKMKKKMLFTLSRVRTRNPEFSKKATQFEQRSNPLGHGGTLLIMARKLI